MTIQTAPSIKYNSKSFFHYPAPREDLKLSAKKQLEKLSKNRSLSTRDRQILLALNDTGILTRNQIQQLFFPSPNTARRKLKTMYENHLLDCGSDDWFMHIKDAIDRTNQQILIKGTPTDDYGLVKSFTYTPALTGRHLISLETHTPLQDINFDADRYTAFYYTQITLHDLWISEAYVKFRLALEKLNLSFTWANEKQSIMHYRNESDKEVVRPDATFITEFSLQPEKSTFQSAKFIEMDRGSTQWENKVSMYNIAFDEGNWKKSFAHFPYVLCVVPDRLYEKAIQSIQVNLESVEFCVASWSDFLSDPLSWFSVNSGENISIIPPHYFTD